MAWTTPKTDWETGELVAASDMNAIGKNLALLKNLASAVHTTTAKISENTRGAFQDVDGTNLNLSIVTTGGDVLVHFDGTLMRKYVGNSSVDTDNSFDIEVDGVRQGDDNGIMKIRTRSTPRGASFTRLFKNLNPGTHTFKLQWKNVGTGVDLFAGAQFWVREI